jgi:hypothetical protein
MKYRDFFRDLNENQEPAVKNQLDGRSKQSAKTFAYSKLHNLTTGFFKDEYWNGVKKILETASQLGFPFNIIKTEYRGNGEGVNTSKVWYVEVPFINNQGKEDKLVGNITASGAGPVEDPLKIYDLTLILS